MCSELRLLSYKFLFIFSFQFFAGAINCLEGIAAASDTDNASPITVVAKLDKKEATVGDVITYALIVRHDPDIKPSPPEFKPVEGFDTVDQGENKPRNIDAWLETEYWLRLRADHVGSHTIPPVQIPFEAPDPNRPSGTIQGTITALEVSIEVASILRLQGEPTDIRDIKPIIDPGIDWFFWTMIAAGSIALIVIAVLFWKKRKRSPSGSPIYAALPLPPHELALKEIELLKGKKLLQAGNFREYYFELSEIFRRYLAALYHFPALDWTTEEITAKIDRMHEIDEPSGEIAGSLLKAMDKVKFSKEAFPKGANETHSVISFIQVTHQLSQRQPTLETAAEPS